MNATNWTPKNGEIVTEEYNHDCPAHGSQIRKEYDFGKRDATVVVFSGCKCACRINNWNEVTYFTDYKAAAGSAELVKAANRW